jgi:hypothetical protein
MPVPAFSSHLLLQLVIAKHSLARNVKFNVKRELLRGTCMETEGGGGVTIACHHHYTNANPPQPFMLSPGFSLRFAKEGLHRNNDFFWFGLHCLLQRRALGLG